MLGPDGRPDAIINDFLSGRGSAKPLAASSARTYAYDIGTFCNVLGSIGKHWRSATTDDLGFVKGWRLYDERNPRLVSDSTWQRQSEAIAGLYKYASRWGVPNPVPGSYDHRGVRVHNSGGDYVRSSSVKWFSPNAIASWRDAGMAGILPDGSESRSFRGRSSQRDCAFLDALYGTGLRVQEMGNLLAGLEWPVEVDARRRYIGLELADSIAKGRIGRRFWAPASALSAVRGYVLGERASVVRRASKRGQYEALADKLVLESQGPRSYKVKEPDGRTRDIPRAWLSIEDRRRLFRKTENGYEPCALWLTSDGRPMRHSSWNVVFDRANERLQQLGLNFPRLTPHHLRHSFALRWFSVGRLLWAGRTRLLTEEEGRDFREEMGSQWFLVQTLLGHRNVSTTRDIYLEPFAGLDIEILMAQIEHESTPELLRMFLTEHPRVQFQEVW